MRNIDNLILAVNHYCQNYKKYEKNSWIPIEDIYKDTFGYCFEIYPDEKLKFFLDSKKEILYEIKEQKILIFHKNSAKDDLFDIFFMIKDSIKSIQDLLGTLLITILIISFFYLIFNGFELNGIKTQLFNQKDSVKKLVPSGFICIFTFYLITNFLLFNFFENKYKFNMKSFLIVWIFSLAVIQYVKSFIFEENFFIVSFTSFFDPFLLITIILFLLLTKNIFRITNFSLILYSLVKKKTDIEYWNLKNRYFSLLCNFLHMPEKTNFYTKNKKIKKIPLFLIALNCFLIFFISPSYQEYKDSYYRTFYSFNTDLYCTNISPYAEIIKSNGIAFIDYEYYENNYSLLGFGIIDENKKLKPINIKNIDNQEKRFLPIPCEHNYFFKIKK